MPVASRQPSSRKLPSWTLLDIALVVACPFVTGFLYGRLLPYWQVLQGAGAQLIFVYGVWIFEIGLVCWLVRRRGISLASLGLARGKRGLALLAGVVLGCTLAQGFLEYALMYGGAWIPRLPGLVAERWKELLGLPFTAQGFLQVVLVPVGAELIYRGLIFGYLRRRTPLPAALFLQALVAVGLANLPALQAPFSLMMGLLVVRSLAAGLIFEWSGTLYASMVFSGLLGSMVYVFGHP